LIRSLTVYLSEPPCSDETVKDKDRCVLLSVGDGIRTDPSLQMHMYYNLKKKTARVPLLPV
jgi:hypothetical protein